MSGVAFLDDDALTGVWTAAGMPAGELSAVRLTGRDPALPSIFRVTTAASASIAAATLGAAGLLADRNREPLREVRVDALHAAVAFRSERHVRLLDGVIGELWDPLAGDYRTADGWIRLHTNYPHHRAAALHVLGVTPDRAAVTALVARRPGQELETAVIAAGGVAAALRSRDERRITVLLPPTTICCANLDPPSKGGSAPRDQPWQPSWYIPAIRLVLRTKLLAQRGLFDDHDDCEREHPEEHTPHRDALIAEQKRFAQ